MRARLALVLLAACGEPAAHVQLAPVPLPGGCGLTTNKTSLRVIAFTPGGQLRRTVPPTEIDAFPADTEQLGVEVVGGSTGLLAIGKTAVLEYGELAEGTQIPILMVPPNGFCPVGALGEPRVAPLVARAGEGVLVAGGTGASGEPLSSAEYFDPRAATFSAIEVPSLLVDAANGLAGAVLTELPDGRVALSGTASHALTIFDPATRTFSTPTLFDHRAYHGAVAPDDEHLFVIGGCADVVSGACATPYLRTGFSYELANVANRTRGPTLDDNAARVGAHIERIGLGASGEDEYVLVGGSGDADVADRFTIAGDSATTITGLHAQTVVLDGGALFSALDADGTGQTGAASMAAPTATSATAMQLAPRLDGAR
ncbi:MAG TPA: hypothetical protein VMZ53_18885, partial [Kofleriaceae bacterium]|nr:hypothetical protein [Kofleriaceae bacterium]